MLDHFGKVTTDEKKVVDSQLTGVQAGYAGSAQFYATGDASQAHPQQAMEVKSIEQKGEFQNQQSSMQMVNNAGTGQMQLTVPQGAMVSANTVDTGMGEGVVVSVQPQTVPILEQSGENKVPVQVSDVKIGVEGTQTRQSTSPVGQVLLSPTNANNGQQGQVQIQISGQQNQQGQQGQMGQGQMGFQQPMQMQMGFNSQQQQQAMLAQQQMQQQQMLMQQQQMQQQQMMGMGMNQPMMQPALPPGWAMGQDAQGRVFYLNHTTQTTQWNHPGAPPSM
jgi:hypothetical protein